jgi:hypothetical protein
MSALSPVRPLLLAATLAAASMLGTPGMAQDTATPVPAVPAGTTTPPANGTPGPSAAATTPTEPQTNATPGAPKLVVASVRLDGGWRASKFLGSAVYDDQNQKIGTVDDLIMSGKDTVAVAILSVGGFLGIGNKLVAVPFDQLRYDPSSKDAKVVMPDANKDTLASMPSFVYSNG